MAWGNSYADRNSAGWSRFTTPTITPLSQSIGGYANGCINGAVALPLSGSGYQAMRISRNRYYGHPQLIQFIEHLGQAAVDEQLGTLLVGDLGQPRGGPTPSGHRSHQSGLDVDIWFLLLKPSNDHLLSTAEREKWGAPSMLDVGADKVDYHQWTQAHAKILQIAAQQPEVDRIFVNPAIKQELCEHKTKTSSQWLQKIRPWWKHDDHFHVRLKCPDNSPNCQKQAPVPLSDGCDASLAWWFSYEAKHPSTTKPAKPHKAPPLPALCEQVFNQ